MDSNATRYEIELELLERRPDLGEFAAIALLRSDFQLALNASHFIALSAVDPEIDIVSRTIPQEGVARYELTLEIVERRAMSEQQAIALVYSEFRRAINASYFWRLSDEDPTVTVVSRSPVIDVLQWRRAA
jgi:EAL domain-containing protein (putative c-di-GMP-specific phosphodiesterase class I)